MVTAAQAKTDEFEFPDPDKENLSSPEVDVTTAGEDVDVAIVDDTPEEDRGRPPPKAVEDPTDEEIEGYSEKVQTRIKDLTRARHDERRAREQVQREQQEAVRIAQALLQENQQLRQVVDTGGKAYGETIKSKAQADLETARRELKAAHDVFDTDKIVEAQEKLNVAQMQLRDAQNFRPPSVQRTEIPVQTPQAQPKAAPPLDDLTLSWQAKNQWFGADGYEEATAFALAVDQKLQAEGVAPKGPTASKYYERVDARLREKFPEIFERAGARKRPSSVVSGVSRSAAGGNKRIVQLSKTQVALAEKMGITPQQYAAELVKLERANG